MEDSLLLKTDYFLQGILLSLLSPFLQSIAAIFGVTSEPVSRLLVAEPCPSSSSKHTKLADGGPMGVALPSTQPPKRCTLRSLTLMAT